MTVATTIESALGSGSLVDDPSAFMVDGRPAAAVAAPSSIDELAELLKLASAENWHVAPAGQGTWLAAGNPLDGVDLVITTLRLGGAIEHHPDDLLATVSAGTSLASLHTALAAKNQGWPLDPLGGGSVGACIATASSGSLAMAYGTPRDLVLGLTVVRADGCVIKAGGRVVKNVAGYDMVKLFTGSWGTLGIIAQAHLRLHALSSCDRGLIAFADAPDTLATLARQLARSDALAPAAAEILSPQAAAAMQVDTPDWCLIVRWLGHDLAVMDAVENAGAILDAGGVRIEDGTGPLIGLPSIEERLSPAVTVRLNAPPLATDELISLARTFDGSEAPAVVAAPFLGRVWAFVSEPAYAAAAPHTWATRVEDLRRNAQRRPGYLRLERAPNDLRALTDAWGSPGDAISLQRALKAKFDAGRILNAGRFVGRI